MLTQEILQEWFYYKNGNLYWKKSKSGVLSERFHLPVGSMGERYILFKFNGTRTFLHRAIFLFHNGYLPKAVDHIDNDRLNNNIENLREATPSQNGMNVSAKKGCTSIYKGVCKKANKWYSAIKINKKTTAIGYFKSERAAALAYLQKAQIHHGEFCNVKKSA